MNKCSDYLSGTDRAADNSVTLYGNNNVLPQGKVLCKDEMTDFDLSMKDLNSNEETDYLSGNISVLKNSVALADPGYVSPQIVVDIEDQLVSNDEILYLSDTDSEPKNTLAFNDPSYVISPKKLSELCENETADIDLSVEKFIYNEETDYLSETVSVPKNSDTLADPSYVSPQIVVDIEDQLVSNNEIICLSDTDSEPKNTLAFNDPSYIISQKKLNDLCENETADIDLSVEKFTYNEETDYVIDSNSVSKNTVKLEDPSYVSPQIVVDIEDQLVSNNEIINLGGTDSEPKNTLAFNDPSYVAPQIVADENQLTSNEEMIYYGSSDSMAQKAAMTEDSIYVLHQVNFDHDNALPQKTLALKEDPNYNPTQQVLTSAEETVSLNSTNSVPQNTVKHEGPSHVSQQVVADIAAKVISNEIIYLGGTDSVQQKTLTLIDPNYIPTPQLLTSNEKKEHLSETDSVPKNTVSLDDPKYGIPCKKLKVLCKNETTDDSCEKKSTSNEKTDCLRDTDSVPKNTSFVPRLDPNYRIPRKKLKVLYKNETDNDSCVKKLTSNEGTGISNGTNSLLQNTVKLEDTSYVSPQVVADNVDQSTSNEIYLGGTNFGQQKTAIPEDRNYVQHKVDFDQADSLPQKTLELKDDPNYVPPQQVFENEKADIVDPRWETVKELTSNEERYEQVKACWGSSTVPDPDKNLTYHSFRRKKILRSGEIKQRVKQHKRKASTILNNETKRPCTYLVDKEINEAVRQKEEKSRKIQKEMNRAIDELRERHYQEEICYGNNMAFNYRTGGNSYYARTYQNTVLTNLRLEHQRELLYVRDKYNKKTIECTSQIDLKLNDLEKIRQEVLQFYTFYKGMGINIEKDPTVLTEFQLKVLNDIENFYKQMKKFYK